MGRELCFQLVKSGCAVATCDVLMENLEETQKLCSEVAPGIKVTLFNSRKVWLFCYKNIKRLHAITRDPPSNCGDANSKRDC